MELTKVTDEVEFEFEIWQPDLRADKIYPAKLSDRVIHFSFPCNELSVCKGLKKVKEYFSPEVIERIIEFQLSAIKILFVSNLEKNKLNLEFRKRNFPLIYSSLG